MKKFFTLGAVAAISVLALVAPFCTPVSDAAFDDASSTVQSQMHGDTPAIAHFLTESTQRQQALAAEESLRAVMKTAVDSFEREEQADTYRSVSGEAGFAIVGDRDVESEAEELGGSDPDNTIPAESLGMTEQERQQTTLGQ
ncbi:MAG: hypothetical protein WCS85_01875 [Candidatus Peribacteraceae bacterium]|jgi:hypothetical protein